MSKELKEVYEKLEPLKFSRLECNDFEGVLLDRDDCILIVRKIVKMEFELREFRKVKKEVLNLKCD